MLVSQDGDRSRVDREVVAHGEGEIAPAGDEDSGEVAWGWGWIVEQGEFGRRRLHGGGAGRRGWEGGGPGEIS